MNEPAPSVGPETCIPSAESKQTPHEPDLLPHETYKALTDLWSHCMTQATSVEYSRERRAYLDCAARIEKILGSRAEEILGAHRARVESRR